MDLISIDSLTDEAIAAILERGESWFVQSRAGRSTGSLKGRLVFNLFYESSTRTAIRR